MIPIQENDLINGSTYYIESHGPAGLISKMRGTFLEWSGSTPIIQYNNTILRQFNNAVHYINGDSVSLRNNLHTPSTSPEDPPYAYFWKYFIPANEILNQKVKRFDTNVILTKMLLIRQLYAKRIGDSSTIMGLIHGRYGLSKRK